MEAWLRSVPNGMVIAWMGVGMLLVALAWSTSQYTMVFAAGLLAAWALGRSRWNGVHVGPAALWYRHAYALDPSTATARDGQAHTLVFDGEGTRHTLRLPEDLARRVSARARSGRWGWEAPSEPWWMPAAVVAALCVSLLGWGGVAAVVYLGGLWWALHAAVALWTRRASGPSGSWGGRLQLCFASPRLRSKVTVLLGMAPVGTLPLWALVARPDLLLPLVAVVTSAVTLFVAWSLSRLGDEDATLPDDAQLAWADGPVFETEDGLTLARDVRKLSVAGWMLAGRSGALPSVATVPMMNGTLLVWSRWHGVLLAPAFVAAAWPLLVGVVWSGWSLDAFGQNMAWAVEVLPAVKVVGWGARAFPTAFRVWLLSSPVVVYLACLVAAANWTERRLEDEGALVIQGSTARATLLLEGREVRFMLEDIVRMTPSWRALTLVLRDGRRLRVPTSAAADLQQAIADLGPLDCRVDEAMIARMVPLRQAAG